MYDLGKWGKYIVFVGVQYMGLKLEEKEYGLVYLYFNFWGGLNVVDFYNCYSYKNLMDYIFFCYGV